MVVFGHYVGADFGRELFEGTYSDCLEFIESELFLRDFYSLNICFDNGTICQRIVSYY